MIQTLRILLIKIMYDDVNIWISSDILMFTYIKSWNKVYNEMCMGILAQIHIVHAHEVFMVV